MKTWPNEEDSAFIALVTENIRKPSGAGLDATAENLVVTFDPPLTPTEQQAYDDIIGLVHTRQVMTLTAYSEVREQMLVLRDLRQLGRNAFVALSAVERDRALYDAQNATTQVLLSILRD